MKIFKFLLSRDVVLTVVGLLVGLIITHVYYLKSIADLKADIEERKRVEELTFRSFESIGTIKYNRDASGKVTGVIVDLSGIATGNVLASGTLTDAPPEHEK